MEEKVRVWFVKDGPTVLQKSAEERPQPLWSSERYLDGFLGEVSSWGVTVTWDPTSHTQKFIKRRYPWHVIEFIGSYPSE